MEKYRINPSSGLEFGIYTLGDHIADPHTGERISSQQRIKEIIEVAKMAEQADINFFSVGESHQEYFTSQGHTVLLGAVAQATEKNKIASSSTIISTLDPVRIYEDVINIGSPELIIEKILYQHEVFGHQRYIGQMDFGGISIEKLKRNIDIIGTKILPEIRKHTRKK